MPWAPQQQQLCNSADRACAAWSARKADPIGRPHRTAHGPNWSTQNPNRRKRRRVLADDLFAAIDSEQNGEISSRDLRKHLEAMAMASYSLKGRSTAS